MASISIPACPGQTRVSDDRPWFVLNGLQPSKCTICPECYYKYANTLLKGVSCTTYGGTRIGSFNCDFANELWNNTISVAIKDPRVKGARKLYPIAPVTTTEDRNAGYAKVALPTASPYAIEIKKWTPDPDVYFTIEECKVGDDKVKINGGKQIYYPDSCDIEGKETGAKGGFLFLSLTGTERKEGKTLPGYNAANIIKLSVKVWRKKEKPLSVPRFYRSTNGGIIFGFPGIDAMDDGPTFSFGLPRSARHSDFSFGTPAASATSFSFGGTSEDSPVYKGLEAAPGSETKYSGGTTLADSRTIDHVKTVTTDARFEPELDGRTLTFTIQLICTDSDTAKSFNNALYFAKEARTKLQQINRDLNFKQGLLAQVRSEFVKQESMLSAQVQSLQTQQLQLDTELREYEAIYGGLSSVSPPSSKTADEEHLMNLE